MLSELLCSEYRYSEHIDVAFGHALDLGCH